MTNNDERYLAACPLGCDAGWETTDIMLPEGGLLRCAGCGQLVSQCTPERFSATMEEFNDPRGTWPTPESAPSLQRGVRKFLARAERVLGRPRHEWRLLDVGCSNGAFLYTAGQCGVKGVGVEPAPAAAAAAREAGLDVRQGFLADLALPAASFDLITLFEVVEHLREPLPLLKECHRLLRPGGVVFIKTGNTASWTVRAQKGSWHYFDLGKHGGHISFFNPDSLALLARKTGFEPVEMVTKNAALWEGEQFPGWLRRPAKITGELLQLPAKLRGRGDALFAFLRKS